MKKKQRPGYCDMTCDDIKTCVLNARADILDIIMQLHEKTGIWPYELSFECDYQNESGKEETPIVTLSLALPLI